MILTSFSSPIPGFLNWENTHLEAPHGLDIAQLLASEGSIRPPLPIAVDRPVRVIPHSQAEWDKKGRPRRKRFAALCMPNTGLRRAKQAQWKSGCKHEIGPASRGMASRGVAARGKVQELLLRARLLVDAQGAIVLLLPDKTNRNYAI